MNTLLAAAILTLPCLAQSDETRANEDPTTPTQEALATESARDRQRRLLVEWENFKTEQGAEWRSRWSSRSGVVRTIHGGHSADPEFTPAGVAPRRLLLEYASLFGIDAPGVELVDTPGGGQPLGEHTRWQLTQRYRGIDVYRSSAILLVDAGGHVVHVSNSFWPVRELDIKATLSEFDARDLLTQVRGPEPADFLIEPKLVVYPEGRGRLAYLGVLRESGGLIPHEIVIDAHSGETLRHTKLALDSRHCSSSTQSAQTSAQGATPLNDRQRRALANPPPPTPIPPPLDASSEVCGESWQIYGPAGDVAITDLGTPPHPYEVRIDVGISSTGAGEDGTQLNAGYLAGLKLLPCKDYRVYINGTGFTWDSYNGIAGGNDGYWDAFLANVNSDGYLWELLNGAPVGESLCGWGPATGGYPAGTSWFMGGINWNDGVLCSSNGVFQLNYEELDSDLQPHLNIGLDTGITGNVDGVYPSWGNFTVRIEGNTHVFNPSPYAQQPGAAHIIGVDSEVDCVAYQEIELDHFSNHLDPDGYWTLKGDYVVIDEKIDTPHNPYPRWVDDTFPFTRSCDEFEAVMAYWHITESMKEVEQLGFTLKNKPIHVDPHGLDGAFNSYFLPDVVCTGCTNTAMSCGSIVLGGGIGGPEHGEDADVIIHEYGHALQFDQSCGAYGGAGSRGWGNETWAMGEGFGDWWAATSNTPNSLDDPEAIGEWAEQDPLGLRRLDEGKCYPDAMVNQQHQDGEIWSQALWDVFMAEGRTVSAKIVLRSHTTINDDPTFCDGAVEILAADQFLYNGIHKDTIVQAFEDRGIFRRVEVESNAPLVYIETSVDDVCGDGNGVTDFERVYCHPELDLLAAPPEIIPMVELTAPQYHLGLVFSHWEVNGQAEPQGVRTVGLPRPGYVACVSDNHPTDPTFTPTKDKAIAIYECGDGSPLPTQPVDCGGTEECPVVGVPYQVGSARTESPSDTLCLQDSGYGLSGTSLGGLLVNTPPITSLSMFTDAPSIDVISGGNVVTHAVAGAELYAAGGVCSTLGSVTVGEVFALSESHLNVLVGGQLTSHPMPPGSVPISAAGVGADSSGVSLFTLCIETSAPSIECFLGGAQASFPLPAALVDIPASWTNGDAAGVIAFSQTAAHVIVAGTFSSIPLSGDYISYSALQDGVLVQTTGGSDNIALATGVQLVPFGTCSPGQGAISMNVSLSPSIAAESAGWAPAGICCFDGTTSSWPGGPFGACNVFIDCNLNSVPDDVDIQIGTSQDCNGNGVPDECDLVGNDCNANGVPDGCDVDCNANGMPDDCEALADCDSNGTPDECELAGNDCNSNGIPDQCDTDCDLNGIPDDCGSIVDCNSNGVPDACDLLGNDCNGNSVPDECDLDCDANGTPDDCDSIIDCNGNGVHDSCDIAAGNSADVDGDGIPDECGNGSAFCFGDGSGTPCPCTPGSSGSGCASSTTSGAVLTGTGSAQFSSDTFGLSAAGVPANKAGLCVKGTNLIGGGNGIQIGDGLLCTTPERRSQVIVSNSNGDVSMTNWRGVPFGTHQGVANTGAPTYYQWWFRDQAHACTGLGFNFSNAWAVTWAP